MTLNISFYPLEESSSILQRKMKYIVIYNQKRREVFLLKINLYFRICRSLGFIKLLHLDL